MSAPKSAPEPSKPAAEAPEKETVPSSGNPNIDSVNKRIRAINKKLRRIETIAEKQKTKTLEKEEEVALSQKENLIATVAELEGLKKLLEKNEAARIEADALKAAELNALQAAFLVHVFQLGAALTRRSAELASLFANPEESEAVLGHLSSFHEIVFTSGAGAKEHLAGFLNGKVTLAGHPLDALVAKLETISSLPAPTTDSTSPNTTQEPSQSDSVPSDSSPNESWVIVNDKAEEVVVSTPTDAPLESVPAETQPQQHQQPPPQQHVPAPVPVLQFQFMMDEPLQDPAIMEISQGVVPIQDGHQAGVPQDPSVSSSEKPHQQRNRRRRGNRPGQSEGEQHPQQNGDTASSTDNAQPSADGAPRNNAGSRRRPKPELRHYAPQAPPYNPPPQYTQIANGAPNGGSEHPQQHQGARPQRDRQDRPPRRERDPNSAPREGGRGGFEGGRGGFEGGRGQGMRRGRGGNPPGAPRPQQPVQ